MKISGGFSSTMLSVGGVQIRLKWWVALVALLCLLLLAFAVANDAASAERWLA